MAASIASLYIINKQGSLIYQQDLAGSAYQTLSSNDKIRLASTFHALSAIASQVAPVRSPGGQGQLGFLQPQGITMIEADTFRLHCFHALTGLRIFAVCPGSPNSWTNCDEVLRQVYDAFCDYVLKNPFYELDMPIRCELFDQEVMRILQPGNPRGVV